MADTQHATPIQAAVNDAAADDNNDHDKNSSRIHDNAMADDKAVDQQLSSSQNASIHIQEVTDRALRFLSHASNETLGACLIGLGATTYFVLGRVGLLLIGMVGGIALHATWDSDNSHADRVSAREADQKKRREIGLEVVQRVFNWKENKSGQSESDSSDDEVKALSSKKLDFSSFRPDTAAALNVFTDAIIRDYVKYV